MPGNEQRGYWGSDAADQSGSDNILGIKNPAVDEMITKLLQAKTRDDLIAATRALDRILLWNQYVVPQWGYGKLRTARWNRFGRPDPMPKYGMAAFPAVWWWDADRAGKTGGKANPIGLHLSGAFGRLMPCNDQVVLPEAILVLMNSW